MRTPAILRRLSARSRSSHGRFRPVVEACESRSLLSGMSGTVTFTNYHWAESVTFQLNGSPLTTAAGDYEASLNGAPLSTVVYCVDLTSFINQFQSWNVHTASTSGVTNGAEIAYLVNHEAPAISAQLLGGGTPTQTAMDESTGLQLAIWQLEYGSNFQIGSNGATPGALYYMNQFLAEGAGKSDAATYLQPDNPNNGQGFVVPGQGYTQGFWKNHPNAWPTTSLTLGGVTLSEAQLLTILETPPKKGDAALTLLHQLIAAELNVINGDFPPPNVVTAINQANTDLAGLISSSGAVTYVSSSSPLGQDMTNLANTLDAFNSANGG